VTTHARISSLSPLWRIVKHPSVYSSGCLCLALRALGRAMLLRGALLRWPAAAPRALRRLPFCARPRCAGGLPPTAPARGLPTPHALLALSPRAAPALPLSLRALSCAAGKGKAKGGKKKDKDASVASVAAAAPAAAAPPPPPANEELYLDVDVMIVESTPQSSQLSSLAADLEACAPSLLQAVLATPLAHPPAALRALQTGAVGAELSVALCGDEYLRLLNAEWRGVDETTDVLSFPQLEPDEQHGGAVLIPGGHALLGDVVVSVETAARQAALRGVTLEEEVQLLLVHGLLHLLGYDHEDGGLQAEEMAAEEARVLLRMGWGGAGLVRSAHTGAADAQQQEPEGAAQDSGGGGGGGGGVLRASRQTEVDLLFCDLDGTLLNSQGLVSPATAQALRAAQARGVRVLIATGKARPGAVAALRASGLSAAGGICTLQGPGVFLNGVLVYDAAGTLTYRRELGNDVCADVLALAQMAGIPAAAFTGDECACLAPSELLDVLHTRYYEPRAQLLPSLAALLAGPPVVKILLYAHTAAAIDALRPRCEAMLLGRATVVQAVPEMLEVLPFAASKGAGAHRLLQALGVPPHRAAAIGDGENDRDLLRLVGCGIAMANAVPITREAATHVLTRSNDQDGVAEAIERFIL